MSRRAIRSSSTRRNSATLLRFCTAPTAACSSRTCPTKAGSSSGRDNIDETVIVVDGDLKPAEIVTAENTVDAERLHEVGIHHRNFHVIQVRDNQPHGLEHPHLRWNVTAGGQNPAGLPLRQTETVGHRRGQNRITCPC